MKKKKNRRLLCTVPWLLIKSFEKSDFASEWLENVPNVQKMCILQIFLWDYPMVALKIVNLLNRVLRRETPMSGFTILGPLERVREIAQNWVQGCKIDYWRFAPRNTVKFLNSPQPPHTIRGPIIHTIIHMTNAQY